MRSNRQFKTEAIQLGKTAARKIKPHPGGRAANRQSLGVILAD
jgi:hypothetical protein